MLNADTALDEATTADESHTTDESPDTVRELPSYVAELASKPRAMSPTLERYLQSAVESANDYAEEALSASTRRAYSRAFRVFEAWTRANGLESLPATPATISVYLAHMADSGLSVSTIVQTWAAIRKAHAERGHALAEYVIQRTLSGIRRRLGVAPAKKSPIVDLVALLGSCPATDLRGIRDRALVLLGWFGAFRRSELVALTVADVKRVRLGLEVTVRRSKTDQEGKGLVKGIPFAINPDLCPVSALDAWLAASGIAGGVVFREINKYGQATSPLCGQAVARIVKQLAAASGLDPDKFSGHSLRSGFVTTAASKGKSIDAIMRQTGHKSVEVLMGYIRVANVFESNAATGLA